MITLFDFITHMKSRTIQAQSGKTGCAKVICTVGKILAMPLVGLVYFLAMPFIFVFFVGSFLIYWVAGSFGWRPSEAYLAGKKKRASAGEHSK
jgi:hypothetical protein